MSRRDPNIFLDDASLNQPFVTVSGQIDSNDYTVWVNGVRVDSSTFMPNGAGGWTWTTDGVPLNPGGTAAVQATVIPNSSNNGNGTPPGDGGGAGNGGPGGGKVPPNPSDPSATVAQTNQERPARVYIEEYSINWSSSVTPYTDLDSESLEMSWTNGVGGTRTEFITWDNRMGNETRTDVYSWPADSYLPTKNGTLTVSSLNPGTYTCLSPANYLRMESCSVAGSDVMSEGTKGTLDFPVWNNYSRTAQATVKLQTGGKAQIKRRNLFCLQATVDEVTGPMYNHWDLADTSVKTNVPSTQVSIGGYGKLGSDGKLWVGLPDNESVDITPKTKARYYTFDDISASKHLLIVTANSALLAPNRFAYGSTNCVGQKVNLESTLLPQVSEITSAEYEWILHGGFKNRITAGSAGCTIYDIEESIQRLQNTCAWWYIKGTKGIVCRWSNITFSNGQKVENINVFGKMKMVKPTVQMLSGPNLPPSFNIMYNLWPLYPIAKLKLGAEDGYNGANTSMNFMLVIDPKDFSGKAILTQLCSLCYSYPGPSFAEWKLDAHIGGEFYEGPIGIAPGQNNGIGFDDNPDFISSYLISPIRVQGSFRVYCRFKPNAGIADENIWVTLGIVDWSAHGETAEGLLVYPNIVTGPAGPLQSDEFPIWNSQWP